jgi:hypothetical protein
MDYKQLLSLFLPEGLLDHFDIDHIEQGKEANSLEFLHIHLTEKNTLPNVTARPSTSLQVG